MNASMCHVNELITCKRIGDARRLALTLDPVNTNLADLRGTLTMRATARDGHTPKRHHAHPAIVVHGGRNVLGDQPIEMCLRGVGGWFGVG